MTWIVTAMLVYVAATALWWWIIRAQRPHHCRKGHTDYYLTPNGWRCRDCAVLAERARLRRIHKEMYEAARRDRG